MGPHKSEWIISSGSFVTRVDVGKGVLVSFPRMHISHVSNLSLSLMSNPLTVSCFAIRMRSRSFRCPNLRCHFSKFDEFKAEIFLH